MYRIDEKQLRELRARMKKEKKAKVYKRLQAVALRGEGKTNGEVATITGFHPDYTSKLCKTYLTNGIEGLIKDGRKGGNHRNMTETEAIKFLQKFEELAKSGHVITVEAIGKAYDEAIGKEHKSLSSVYYFLHRYGWRKIIPQRQHPGKASEEVIEASKKLTVSSRR